jgi:hypothetical protein
MGVFQQYKRDYFVPARWGHQNLEPTNKRLTALENKSQERF